MRYTKPLVTKMEGATAVIQQQSQSGPDNKNALNSVDQSFISCTPGAYEADE